jgi:glycosyltransferase involved in cell wall biosynthesis
MSRVLNLMPARGRGGLERVAAQYARLLAIGGHEVLTLGHPDGYMRGELDAGADFAPLVAVSDYDPRGPREIRRAIARFEPDVLLAHGNRAIRWVSRMRGPRRIAVLHNFRFRPLTASLDGAIAVSETVARAARDAFASLSVTVVPNAIDPPAPAERPPRREPPVIGALGRLHRNKGFDVLLEALASEALADRPWRLVIAGAGSERAALDDIVSRRGLRPRVEFVGWISDRATFFASIDMLCVPSRVEPFGLVLIEGLAHGVPCVASRACGAAATLADGREALVVEAGSPRDLALALRGLLDDEAGARAIGEAGRRAASRFSPDAAARALTRAITLPR